MMSKETFQLGLKICMGILFLLIVIINVQKLDVFKSEPKPTTFVLEEEIHLVTKSAIRYILPIKIRTKMVNNITMEKAQYDRLNKKIMIYFKQGLKEYAFEYKNIEDIKMLVDFACDIKEKVEELHKTAKYFDDVLFITDVTTDELVVEPRVMDAFLQQMKAKQDLKIKKMKMEAIAEELKQLVEAGKLN